MYNNDIINGISCILKNNNNIKLNLIIKPNF